MKLNTLNNTNLKVSDLSLGTMMFGGQTNEKDSLEIMDYAFENGINLFDTANIYNAGESEIVVGKGLKGRRDKIILATKVGYPMGGSLHNAGLGKTHILESIDASLKRLDTDYVDLYYMHAPDYNTPIEESLKAMTDLIQSGKVRYFGVSNFAAWQIADILATCKANNFIEPVITQNVYNPITRGIESELLPFLNVHPLALTIYNPIAAGLLAGKHIQGEPAQNTRFSNNKVYFDRYWSESNFRAIESLKEVAASLNLNLLELTMSWCISQSKVDTIITGVSKLSQLEQNINAIKKGTLDTSILNQMTDIWKTLSGNTFGYNR